MNNSVLLKNYLDDSVLISFNDKLKIRLSKELEEKYNKGLYDAYINNFSNCIEIVDTLNLRYPCGAKPIYYLCIFPLDKGYLLDIPKPFDTKNGGGKPIKAHDLDSFNSAFGVTENQCLRTEYPDFSRQNTIHELIHLVSSMFFSKDRYINEGVAEAVTYYCFDYEDVFTNHRERLVEINEDDLYTVKELLEQKEFGLKGIEGTNLCTYRYSYISSYLFMASILDHIKDKYNIDKKETAQILFEALRNTQNYNRWLVDDLADLIDEDSEEMYSTKKLQLEYLNKLKR